MTDFHVHDALSLYHALDQAMPGDNVWQHQGVYYLDSYEVPIRGGSSRAKTLKIRPWRKEKVLWKATGKDFVLRLAHDDCSFVEIGSDLVDSHVDASELKKEGPATAVKITNVGGGHGANHTRFRRFKVHGAFRQGILLSDVHDTQFFGGASYDNGNDDTPEHRNKNHGLYIGGGSWDNKFFEFSTYRNGGYGVHEYGGEERGKLGRNHIIGGYHFQNARLSGNQAGILLGGDLSVAKDFVSTEQAYGVNIYRTARNCSFDGDMFGNTMAPYHISPEATGTQGPLPK